MRHLGLAALPICGAALELAGQAVPYNVDRRPQPRRTLLDTLLRQVVGTFRRPPFAPRTPVSVNEIDLQRADYAPGQDPSYFRTERIMAWSRGGYFFFADASSHGALDRFMPAFPY